MLAQLKKPLTPHELWEDAKFFFLLNLGLVATAAKTGILREYNFVLLQKGGSPDEG